MAEDPITIKGGSFSIKCKTGKLVNERQNADGWSYDHEKDGTIKRVEIDGTPYTANKNSKIVIVYEVPDDQQQP